MAFNKELNDNYVGEIYYNRSDIELNLRGKDGTMLGRIPCKWKKGNNSLDYISQSRVEAYDICPSCFKQVFLDRTLRTDSFFSYFGNVFHEIMETYVNKFIYEDKTLEGEELDELVNSVWQKYPLTDFSVYTTFKHDLDNFLKMFDIRNAPWFPIHTEYELMKKVEGLPVPLNGIADLIAIDRKDNTTFYLIDYKTVRLQYSQAELDNSLQFRLYSYMIKKEFPMCRKIKCIYWELYHGQQVCKEYTDEEIQEALDFVKNTYTQIKNDNQFKEKVNPYCMYRECRHTCESYQRRLREMEFTGKDDIFAEREYYYSLEKIASAKRKDLDKEIKAIIEQEGDVVANGKKYNIKNIKRYSCDYTALYKVLLSYNRLDLLNGFVQVGNADSLKLIIENLPDDDFMLKLQALQCFRVGFSTTAINRAKDLSTKGA